MVRIGVSCGDPAGIGPEIIYKTFKSLHLSSEVKVYLVGEKRCFLNQGYDISKVKGIEFIEERFLGKRKYKIGKESRLSGRAAYIYFHKCMVLLRKNFFDGVVTAPVSKKAINLSGINFRGHTEELEKFFKKNTVMLMSSSQLKTSLFTRHIPLSKVPTQIKRERIEEHIRILVEDLKQMYRISFPRIGVCALNPHGGEKGIFGKEDETLARILKELKYKNLYGPFPSDTLFLQREKYDCIVSLYHDQGMIPFKMLSFQNGCNVTLGLGKVRTSPAHGVAFDIAGRNKALPDSFRFAFLEAVCLVKNLKRCR